MTRWQKVYILAAMAVAISGCKDVVSPHVTPQGDPGRLVASMAAATNEAMLAASEEQQIVLTMNNAPEANEPLEQDFLTEVVELFEKRNPKIRIQYSPWQYTPESFFERLNNRTLTDIVEVDAAQMTPIIEANAAADLTEDVKVTPEMRIMNPDVFRVTSRDGRTYGVPVELHTLALFYNRRLLEESKIVVTQTSEDKEKGKGAASNPREYILENPAAIPDTAPLELAQNNQAPYYYPPGYQAPQRSSGRSDRDVDYYNQQPRQQNQQRRPARTQEEYQEQLREYNRQLEAYQKQNPNYRPQRSEREAPQEDARERRVNSRKKASGQTDDGDPDTSKPKTSSKKPNDETTPDDTLTTEAELAMQEQKTTATDGVTTVIKTAGLPTDLEQFIRLAVRLTDHKKGVAGFGPVLYAREGGREYTQWAVQNGLQMQEISGETVSLDVAKSGEVAQFLKDLHWRFDVTPPPNKCYYDNLMTMFANGKLGMMIMPADVETVRELIKRGMPMNDIGITALPSGMATRDHLTYGKCLVVNSQLGKAHRTAAFKWLMFMASPEVHRLRTQFFFGENEMTAGPSVPLYSKSMQQEYYQSIKPFRALPLWDDYEGIIASNLHLEPSFNTDRFYEAIAEGLRPIIERKDSDPFKAVTLIATDFERKYIQGEKPKDILDQYVQYLMKKKNEN